MNRYRDHFDQLGNRIDRMTVTEEVWCAVAIVWVAVLVSGVLV